MYRAWLVADIAKVRRPDGIPIIMLLNSIHLGSLLLPTMMSIALYTALLAFFIGAENQCAYCTISPYIHLCVWMNSESKARLARA